MKERRWKSILRIIIFASSVRYIVKKVLFISINNDDDINNNCHYLQTDAYQATGCYNLLCSGFVQTNSKIAIGAAISPTSSYSGGQFDISLLIWKVIFWSVYQIDLGKLWKISWMSIQSMLPLFLALYFWLLLFFLYYFY